MPYLHEFGRDDIFINRMITSPQYEFVMYSGSSFINNDRYMGVNIPDGMISLFEYNVDRDGTTQQLIRPFIIKDGSWLAPPSVTPEAYQELEPGTIIYGEYPLTSSISLHLYPSMAYPFPDGTPAEKDTYVDARKGLMALKNTMNYYRMKSNAYEFEREYLSGSVNMVQIPSIFYDTGIDPGTVNLKFYFSGTLVDEAVDKYQNGELISTAGLLSGSTVGVVLYNEGFVLLTNTGSISTNVDNYSGTGVTSESSWIYYGAYSTGSITGSTGTYASSSLYTMSFKGTQSIPTMTMFATAYPGDTDNSLNPTWIDSTRGYWRGSSSVTPNNYVEPSLLDIKNTIQSQYCEFEDEFEKQVFISEIGIFDKDKNLIGVAKLANPVQKKITDDYTFKLKLDL